MSDAVTAQWKLGAGFRLGMRVAGLGGRAAVSCPGAWWSDEGIVGKFSRRFVYKCVFTQCALFSARPPPLAQWRGPARAPALTPAAQRLPKALLILRPAAAAAPGQKRSLLITRGRHSEAADLFSPRTPPLPPVVFARRAPPVPLGGPPRRGTGGRRPLEPGGAFRLDLHAERVPRRSRGEAPPAGTAGRGPHRAPAVGPAAGPAVGPLGPRLNSAPRISSHLDRAQIICFPQLNKYLGH